MRNFHLQIFFIVICAICLNNADPTHTKYHRVRFARQELRSALPTPYPAAGYRPNIPFDLPPTRSRSGHEFRFPEVVDVNTQTESISEVPAVSYGPPPSTKTENSKEQDEFDRQPSEELEPPIYEAADFAVENVNQSGDGDGEDETVATTEITTDRSFEGETATNRQGKVLTDQIPAEEYGPPPQSQDTPSSVSSEQENEVDNPTEIFDNLREVQDGPLVLIRDPSSNFGETSQRIFLVTPQILQQLQVQQQRQQRTNNRLLKV